MFYVSVLDDSFPKISVRSLLLLRNRPPFICLNDLHMFHYRGILVPLGLPQFKGDSLEGVVGPWEGGSFPNYGA
jgi:hypothetical protein